MIPRALLLLFSVSNSFSFFYMSHIERELIFRSKLKMFRLIQDEYHVLEMIKANSKIESFWVNEKEHTVICYGSPSTVHHAQLLMNDFIFFNRNDFKNLLCKYLDHPDLYPNDIQFEDEKIVVVKDGKPKARYHSLVLVKDKSIKGI